MLMRVHVSCIEFLYSIFKESHSAYVERMFISVLPHVLTISHALSMNIVNRENVWVSGTVTSMYQQNCLQKATSLLDSPLNINTTRLFEH